MISCHFRTSTTSQKSTPTKPLKPTNGAEVPSSDGVCHQVQTHLHDELREPHEGADGEEAVHTCPCLDLPRAAVDAAEGKGTRGIVQNINAAIVSSSWCRKKVHARPCFNLPCAAVDAAAGNWREIQKCLCSIRVPKSV